MAAFNPRMLTLARESRGWTQGALAERSGVSQPYISRIEKGLKEPTPEKLNALAGALRYSPEALTLEEPVLGVDALFHRRLKTIPVTVLRQDQAQINLRRIQTRRLLQGIEFDAPNTFPRLDVDEVGGPVEAARLVRRAWRIPFGPIGSVVACLEDAGGVVVPMRFQTPRVSAAALWPREDRRPMFFINADHNGERQRFTLSHELGHMVLHDVPEPEYEDQADTFAAEFLMPEREIRPQLEAHRLNLARLLHIKLHWRVSMSAVVKRAETLGVVSERKARSLWQMLSARGFRDREPFPIDPEQPTLLRAAISLHQQQHRYTAGELAAVAMVKEDEFSAAFPVAGGGQRRFRVVRD
ncbi:MAG TPA: ImmA/IrrE family metallo-endopeptidase [Conexibacter sp.]|nr:ImmA/IrrE family metallo-endopeptidase [Conexibacter sp.]